MIALELFRETLSDGSHVYNGRFVSVEAFAPVQRNPLPEKIEFASEKDAIEFGNQLVNLGLIHANGEFTVRCTW